MDDCVRYLNCAFYANKYNYLMIIPEGGIGMYTNMEYGPKYYDYITKELPRHIQKIFNIDTRPENTYICGFSMGGYGAFKIGLRNMKKFAGIACLSSLTDIRNEVEKARRGIIDGPLRVSDWKAIFGEELIVKDEDDLYKIAEEYKDHENKPLIFQSCGNEDFLKMMNDDYSAFLDRCGYDHAYLCWEGTHSYIAFDRGLELSLRYFAGEKVKAEDRGSYDIF